MKYTLSDILEVLSESTQDYIIDDDPILINEGFVGVTASIIGALAVIMHIKSLLYERKKITLSGNNLNSYRTLIEKYAKENNLPNPKDFKYKDSHEISLSEFENFENNAELLADYVNTIDPYNAKRNPAKAFVDVSNDGAVMKASYNYFCRGSGGTGVLIYKNKVICFGDYAGIKEMNSNIIDKKYAKLVISYHEPILEYNGKNELLTLISFFNKKYPDELVEATKLFRDSKKKRNT